jgi:hypothetical protein
MPKNIGILEYRIDAAQTPPLMQRNATQRCCMAFSLGISECS